MRRAFRIHHDPAPGETVQLLVDYLPEQMAPIGGGWWEARADVDADSVYYYRVVTGEGRVSRIDHGRPRRPLGEYVIVDRWRREDPTRLARHSALFKRARGHLWPGERGASGLRLTIRLHEPAVPEGHTIAIVGSDPALGGWDTHQARPMVPSPFPWWTLTVDLANPLIAGEYRYLIIDEAGSVVLREEGEHRPLPPCEESTVVTDEFMRGIPPWRGTGVAVPVFSLRTERSFGSGQFLDLIPLADWAAEVGISVIQILPVNDTIKDHAWGDSYPYDPISVHALHPLYIDLADLPGGEQLEVAAADLRTRLEAHPEVAYEQVMSAKLELLRALHASTLSDPDVDRFVEDEWSWLGPYSYWCALRDRHGTPDMSEWGDDATFSSDRLEAARLGAQHEELSFWWWLQYHLHRQLRTAADHARGRGVALKGDLPIGVAPNSVETWVHPNLFHPGTQTGAPPDEFSTKGQNWGFPTYDWDQMAEDGYAWWRQRFDALSGYVDAYRIDHILGFFRIWEIPDHAVDGRLGRFRPSKPLSEDEIRARMPDVNIDWLSRPMIDASVIERRFGVEAARVAAQCFEGDSGDLRLRPEFSTQRSAAAAATAGALAGYADPDSVLSNLMDIAADAPLIATEDGFQPRISWQATEAFQRLPGHEQESFTAMANDFFHRRHSGQWRAQGIRTLPAIVDATAMLPCGEDLGMVPDMVPGVMREMGILSLEVEQMPKHLGAWRTDPADAPYLSVVSPATHDMAPIRLWWREHPPVAARYWSDVLGKDGPAPAEATPEVCRSIIEGHLRSPAMLAVVQLQDLLAADADSQGPDPATERINVPADRTHRWRYRCHVAVDDLPTDRWDRL